ncbi:phage terminase large subunit family protein [Aquabacterium sp.]|uniref:phage terminase large subunit family protein n=1 Tax=Aquabacterium sp. TaxID=1872578 RepID=UPI003BAFCCBD
MSLFRNVSATRRIFRTAGGLLRPPPNIKPSDWAEKHVQIPAGNALPGPMRFDNAPYQREVLDLMVDPSCQRITLMWGAQVGKTQTALAAQAYCISMSPRSQIMMQPSQSDLAIWLETKFNPLVASSPEVKRRVAKPRSRSGVNNSRMKSYPGGFMMFAWAGSPKTMRGKSAPFVVCDEVDGYLLTPEGHPVSLLWQRAATFGDQKKLVEISTPTFKGASYIEKAFLAGDQRRFHIRCSHCDEEQYLKWENVVWTGKKATPDDDLKHFDDHDPKSARYACPHCGGLIDDGQRIAAIRAGRWIASRPFKGHASFHLWEAYSTFRRLSDIVQSYLDKLSQGDLATFWNVSLAETWEEKGQSAEPDIIRARAEAPWAVLPDAVKVLTAGVDMQQDRLELEVVGWGVGEESWSVDYVTIWGDPLTPEPWQELEDYLQSEFPHASGRPMRISATCVDTGGTGGYTQAAYDWLRGKTGRRIFAIKGASGFDRPVVSSPNRKQSGKDVRKVDLFIVGTDQAKLTLMRRLQLDKPGPGYMHTPSDRDEEWYLQLCAEKLVTRFIKGFPHREWHKQRDRNEALDCRAYAYAALKLLNTRRLLKGASKTAEAPLPISDEVVEQEVEKTCSELPTREPVKPAEPVATQKKPTKKRKLSRSGGVGPLNW